MAKKLAVYDTQTKRLQGLDPSRASGVPIPAFRSGLILPRAGSIPGEAFINTNTGEANVWNGTTWNPIAKPVVSHYPTEAALLGDTPADGTVAIAESTGNIFTMVTGVWRAMGARVFPTQNARDASSDFPGTIGFVSSTGEWSLRIPSGYIHPAQNPIGTPSTNDADLAAAVTAIIQLGQAGQWLELDPAYTYAGQVGGGTITQLPNAMVGADGDWAIYDGTHFIQVQGTTTAAGNPVASGNPVWAMLNQQTVTVGNTAPATPTTGEQWFDAASRTLFTWDGTAWRAPSVGVPVGTIIQHASVQPPPGYLFCDGSVIPAGAQFDALRALIGPNTPNLINYFIRAARSEADITGFTKHQDTTRRPRTAFTGTAASAGAHSHMANYGGRSSVFANSGNAHSFNTGGETWASEQPIGSLNVLTTAGAHTHNVTITGGGDSETAPAHVYLAYHIRAIE